MPRAWVLVMLAPVLLVLSGCCCPCEDTCGLKACGDGCCGTCERFMEVPEPPAPTMPPPPRTPPGPVPTRAHPVPTSPPTPQPEPLPPGTGFNLGVSAYPPNTSKFEATMYAWRAQSLVPTDYRMGYALEGSEQTSVRASHRAYAKKVGHETEDGEVFRWSPPPGCGGGMTCVFEQLVVRNRPDVLPIAEKFLVRVQSGGLNSLQATQLVISWVQAIRYEVPKQEPFGVLPPALVAAESRGDCDSKALLALMILHELGIKGVLISSSIHRHTMLGVPLPVAGSYFTHQGRRYAFVECTAAGAPIGYLDPKLKKPNDWQAVPVKL